MAGNERFLRAGSRVHLQIALSCGSSALGWDASTSSQPAPGSSGLRWQQLPRGLEGKEDSTLQNAQTQLVSHF